MNPFSISRRRFLTGARVLGAGFATGGLGLATEGMKYSAAEEQSPGERLADCTLHIKLSPIEIAPKRIISVVTYNGQFPGPLLRFREGREVTVDIYNDTDTPDQLHWQGQKVSVDVDGDAEEGTPFVPAHGRRRIQFTPNPVGFRFYHTQYKKAPTFAIGCDCSHRQPSEGSAL
jgi:FtsP/CotA-like multicopper oxidase with cupredoxin domain